VSVSNLKDMEPVLDDSSELGNHFICLSAALGGTFVTCDTLHVIDIEGRAIVRDMLAGFCVGSSAVRQ
jgi:hypothetical protein